MTGSKHKANGADAGLRQQIAKAVGTAREPLTRAEVSEIVRQVLGTLAVDHTGMDVTIIHEIEDLARYIRQAKDDIASIRPKEIKTDHIPMATDELDAVVGATEDATNKIMDECDQINILAGELAPEQSEKLIASVTRIFEACNFQDITGQRITKVVQALKHIDAKIEALMKALGEEAGGESGKTETAVSAAPPSGDDLLNGPQLPGQGINQDEIDKLLGF